MATQVKVTLIGAAGTRTTEVAARGFYTRGFKAPDPNMMPSIFGEDVRLETDSTPAATPPAPTPEPEPKMENHNNDRFQAGVLATLQCLGSGWHSAKSVFRSYYNKYDHANAADIQIGLALLSENGRIQSKPAEVGESQWLYCAPVSDFERFLDTRQMSRYHLAEIAGIDEVVMCGYADGKGMSRKDAAKIAKALGIDASDLDRFLDKSAAEVEWVKVYRTDLPGPKLIMEMDKSGDWVQQCEAYVEKDTSTTLKAIIDDNHIRFFSSYKRWVEERRQDRKQRLSVHLTKGKVS